MTEQKFRVGIVGYSQQQFDQEEAKSILQLAFGGLWFEFGENVEIVSGLTYMGVPGLAYDLAEEYHWTTVGIACKKADGYVCYPVDVRIIVGESWGDESETFLTYCDHFIRVGGGKQSYREVQRAKELGKTVEEYELEVES